MESFASESITELYARLCDAVYFYGFDVGKTKERTNIVSILFNPFSRLIQEPNRKHSLDYMKKEMLWYLSGSTSASWIGQYAKTWQQIADLVGEVNSNYGYTIFYYKVWGGKTQFERVVEELKRDPISRRAVMFFQIPELHYQKMQYTKDFPCTCSVQFLLRQGELNMAIFMRSNDLIYGWCNDMPFFAFVLELVAAKLGVKVGRVTLHSGSLHIYDRHYEIASKALNYKFSFAEKAKEECFPRVKAEEVDKIIRLQPCSYVDFLTDGGKIDIEDIRK